MLQQTTVGAVRVRYGEFLRRFPSLTALARASEDRVLAAWSGLGYYARARHLHRAAREVVAVHGGRLPATLNALRALPGFGPYTAAAVASLAFGARVPAADANVTRVLSRLDALDVHPGSRKAADAVLARAALLVARSRPGDVTAALMDLGQLVCTPRRPACEACPLALLCEARRRDAVHRYPRAKARPRAERVFVAAACARRGGAALLVRGATAWLSGLWQFPSAEGASPAEARRRLSRCLATLGLTLDPRARPATARHTIMNRRLEILVYSARPSGRKTDRGDPMSRRWLTTRQLATAPIPTLTRRVATAAGFLSSRAGSSRTPASPKSRSATI
jgi:A/G-specific adenine glycosylase